MGCVPFYRGSSPPRDLTHVSYVCCSGKQLEPPGILQSGGKDSLWLNECINSHFEIETASGWWPCAYLGNLSSWPGVLETFKRWRMSLVTSRKIFWVDGRVCVLAENAKKEGLIRLSFWVCKWWRWQYVTPKGNSGEGKGYPLQDSGLENPHGQSSLAGYSPRGRKEPDTTEQLTTKWYRWVVFLGLWGLWK